MARHKNPNLTEEQKRAARMVALGVLKPAKIAKILDIDRTTLWHWTKHPKFKKLVHKYNETFDTWIDQNQKKLMEAAFERLYKMIKRGDSETARYAIEAVLKLNRKLVDPKTEVLLKHSGSIVQEHSGSVSQEVIKNLAEKKKIKNFLKEYKSIFDPRSS